MTADAFALDAMGLDAVSVGREDEGFVLSCREHSDEQIETKAIHDLVAEHGLRVRNTVADFDTGEVRLEVVGGDRP